MSDLISREAATLPCPCTMIEQDDDCPIGQPSLLCSVCGGKGFTTAEKVQALAAELLRIASDLGEPEDPFAAWEKMAGRTAAAAPTSDIGNPISGEPVTLAYRNYRGEVSARAIIPRRVWFGSTDWHPEPQWLLTAWDVEKQAERDFALKDFGQPVVQDHTTPAAPAVKVKPLAWRERYEGYWAAEGCNAMFYISEYPGALEPYHLHCPNRGSQCFGTMDEAVAAAQAEHEAGILAALEGGEA